jgi:hypothetical protein
MEQPPFEAFRWENCHGNFSSLKAKQKREACKKQAETAHETSARESSKETNSFGPSLSGEFDPGSERTLAACLTHASRARKGASAPEYSGARVRNTWAICPEDGDNPAKVGLIPNKTTGGNSRG